MRGPLVAVLVELTQGTSCWNETCTRIAGTDHWLICFDYQYLGTSGPVRHWCTPSNDPHPPPPDPGPPPTGWPYDGYEDFSVQVFPIGGFPACCYAGFHGDAVFDPDQFPWGGLVLVLSGEDCPDLVVTVYPTAWDGANVTWIFHWEGAGVTPGDLIATAGVGVWPLFSPGPTGWAPCPDSWVALITTS